MRNTKRLNRLEKLAILVCCLAPCLLVAGGWYFACDWMPDSVTERLPGATRAEVIQMLGEPSSFSSKDQYGNGSRDEAEKWQYERDGRMAEFQVRFDTDGRVNYWGYDR